MILMAWTLLLFLVHWPHCLVELGTGRGSKWGPGACKGHAAEGHQGAAPVSALLACLGQAGADSWQY